MNLAGFAVAVVAFVNLGQDDRRGILRIVLDPALIFLLAVALDVYIDFHIACGNS